MKIHFLRAGDVLMSLGTRYHIGQLVKHMQRRAILASFSLSWQSQTKRILAEFEK